MWRRICVCLVVSGCGFQASGRPGDDAGPPSDSPPASDAALADAMIDGAAAKTCWQHWMDHDLQLTDPAKITELSTTANERDPWLSGDGKRLYFAREPGARNGSSDIYLAVRNAVGDPFGDPDEQDNLDTNDQESRPALTDDELTIALASDRGGGAFQLYIQTRVTVGDTFGSPDQDGLMMVNGPTSDTQHFDPYFANQGLTLYYAPDPPTNERQHIWAATRPTAADPFGMPAKVAMINGDANTVIDSDPALSRDEKVIVFSSTRPGGQGAEDLYYATRTMVPGTFGAPARIPTINSGAADGDPILSLDGCDVYFASTRAAGNYDLYVSHLVK